MPAEPVIISPDRNDWQFPNPELADADGLVLIGGILSVEKVLDAYRKGIFPWYNEDEPVLWWSPDPRFVLYPSELHVSRSLKKSLQKDPFTFTMNTAFAGVIHRCKTIARAGQDGTWITDEMENVYTQLHQMGYALSGETWENGNLVGGIYGIRIGKLFCAESMFSLQTNASKFALVQLVDALAKEGVVLIDCQIYSPHIAAMGARLIPRQDYLSQLKKLVPG